MMTLLVLCSGAAATAQVPEDASARLRQVLPANVATRVLAVIARARSRDLPAEALENRALKFAARGVHPDSIERSIVEHEGRMAKGKAAIESARGGKPASDEVEAAAEVLRKGVGDAKISELAKSAPSGRSLAVPLYVVGGLLDRGLASDAAIKRVADGLRARSSDRELEKMPADLQSRGAAAQNNDRPGETGRANAEVKRPEFARGGQGGVGGPPAGVPANGGSSAKPTFPPGRGKSGTPPGKKP